MVQHLYGGVETRRLLRCRLLSQPAYWLMNDERSRDHPEGLL